MFIARLFFALVTLFAWDALHAAYPGAADILGKLAIVWVVCDVLDGLAGRKVRVS